MDGELVFDTHSNLLMQGVLIASIVLITMALVVLASTLWLRHRHEQRVSHRNAMHRRWRPVLFNYAMGDPVPLPALTPGDIGAFVELWLELSSNLRGDARDPLIGVVDSLDLRPTLRRWLQKGFINQQLTAITALGYLKDEEAWDDILPLLDDPRTVFSLCAARALVNMNPEQAIGPVAAHLYRSDWSTGRLASLLRDIPVERRQPLLRSAIAQADERQTQRLLRLMNTLNPGGYDDAIAQALARFPDSVDILTTALSGMHSKRWRERARAAATAEAWPVRVQATRALGRIGTHQDLPLLDQLLQDKAWWVRRRAAEAIVTLPGLTPEELDRRISTLTDFYARDALQDARLRLAVGGKHHD